MSNLPTGRVHGTFTTDLPGTGPGSAGGDVVFRCDALSVSMDRDGVREIFTPGFVRAKIVDGTLYDADDLTTPGVELLASNVAGVSPTGFTWSARAVITSAGKPVAEQHFTVLVPEGESVDLADYLTAGRSTGTAVILPPVKGDPGKDGVDGKDGAPGREGIDGAPGLPGKDGVDGKDGAPGRDGIDGAPGLPGRDGAPGRDGIDGAPGLPGKDGIDGAPGLPGKDGEPGAPGRDGIDGADGAPGRDGVDGAPGLPGKDGEPGAPGRDGIDGAPGRDGIDGAPGLPGKDGADGAPGRDGATPTFTTGTASYGDSLEVSVVSTGENSYKINLTIPPLDSLETTTAVPTDFAPQNAGLRWADTATFGDPRSRILGDWVLHEGGFTNRGSAITAPSATGWKLFTLGKAFRPQKDITGLALPYVDSTTGMPLGTGSIRVSISASTGQVVMTTAMSSGATVSLTNLRWMERSKLTIGVDANLLAGIGSGRLMGFSGNASSTTTLLPVEYRSGASWQIPTLDSWTNISTEGVIGSASDISTAVYLASNSNLTARNITLEAGFTGSLQCYKTTDGTVLLRGNVSAGTGGSVAAWIPEDLRPATLMSGGTLDAANGRWSITPAGAVIFHTVSNFSRIPGVLYRTA